VGVFPRILRHIFLFFYIWDSSNEYRERQEEGKKEEKKWTEKSKNRKKNKKPIL